MMNSKEVKVKQEHKVFDMIDNHGDWVDLRYLYHNTTLSVGELMKIINSLLKNGLIKRNIDNSKQFKA